MIVETTRKDLFNHWLLWLDPLLNLNESERKILAAFLLLHWTYTKRGNYSPEVLFELLFSDDNKESVRQKINLPKIVFSKAFKGLIEKGLFRDNQIHHLLTRYPKDDKFKLVVDFKLLN